VRLRRAPPRGRDKKEVEGAVEEEDQEEKGCGEKGLPTRGKKDRVRVPGGLGDNEQGAVGAEPIGLSSGSAVREGLLR